MTDTVVPGQAERTPLLRAMGRGFLGSCPHCGADRIFGKFLKVRPHCDVCSLELSHHRADDLPPYIVIFIVAHLVGTGILIAETRFEDTPLWFHLAVWPLLTVVLCLVLLQPVKGAVVGLQYALGMHGFGAARRGAAGAESQGESRRVGYEGAEHHGPSHLHGP